MKILINLENTVLDVKAKLIQDYNQEFGIELNPKNIHALQYEKAFPNWTKDRIEKILTYPQAYKEIYLMDFATIDTLKELSLENVLILYTFNLAHDSAMKVERLQDLTIERYFNQFIFLQKQKSINILKADVIIDDNLHNLMSNSSEHKILFDCYDVYSDVLLPPTIQVVKDWKEIPHALQIIRWRVNGILY